MYQSNLFFGREDGTRVLINSLNFLDGRHWKLLIKTTFMVLCEPGVSVVPPKEHVVMLSFRYTVITEVNLEKKRKYLRYEAKNNIL